MKVLITGASSGIGKEMAIYLSELGYELILVAKEKDKLEEMQQKLKTKTKIIVVELSDIKQVENLYELLKKDNIDILINNAGFGLLGDYNDVDIFKELNMIDVNIKAVHLLTKLFLKDMIKKDKGYILNVSSSASFLRGGPLMSTYYATKSYVTNFTLAIYEELRRNNSKVKISLLCPGPVNTNFNSVAGAKHDLNSLTPKYVARYAIKNMLNNKLIIIPGFTTKIGLFFSKLIPTKILLKITYNIQNKKLK